jgi:hypothetical protein
LVVGSMRMFANAVANADAGTGYFATSAAVDDWKVVVGGQYFYDAVHGGFSDAAHVVVVMRCT